MKTSMRFLAVLFALTVVFASLLCVSAAKYSDVEANKHIEAIDTLSTLGILSGYSDGTFNPDGLVEREEMAKIIFVTATTLYDAGKGNVEFSDVSDGNWARGFISWCHSKNIVSGYGDGTFKPESNITYDEALKMAAAMLGYNDFSSDMWPTDVRTVALKQLNLGENLDGLEGDAQITRAQAAQIIYNSLYQTMNTTEKKVVYDVVGDYVDKEGNDVDPEKVIESKMTLAENVWNIDVVEVQVVATENYGVNFRNPETPKDVDDTIWKASRTGDGELISVRDEENNITTVNLEVYGLEEYEDNTDALMFLTISQMFRDGEEFGSASLKGNLTDGISLAYHKVPVYDAKTTEDLGSGVYAPKNKLTVAGVEYNDEEVFNLRAAVLKDYGVYEIFDFEPRMTTKEDMLNADGSVNANPTDIGDIRHKLIHFYYVAGYKHNAKGWDVNGDGFYDLISIELYSSYKVENVQRINDGTRVYTKVDYKFYHGPSTPASDVVYSIDEEKIVTPAPLKKGDVFIAAKYSDVALKVDAVIEPVKASITKYSGKGKVTATGLGEINSGAMLWSCYKAEQFASSNPYKDYLKPDAYGNLPEFNFYLYNGRVLFFEGEGDEVITSTNKAILLYVDKKTDKILDKLNNKYQSLYPAYLLIDGKEEAVNLNPKNAIDGKSGDYVSDEESEFRAKINEDGTLDYKYIPVTYEVDGNGYYTLSVEFSDIMNDNGTPNDSIDDFAVEKIIKADEEPVLSRHKATGLYTITVKNPGLDNPYNVVAIDADSYIYYTYVKKVTGTYKYMSYYTGETMPEEFEEMAFVSDVFLAYDEDLDMYTIKFGVLEDELVSTGKEDGYVDYKEDARAIYMAVADSALVKFDSETHYEHTLMNVMTGETFTVVNEDKSVVEEANKLTAGNFYAWDNKEEDYVRVYGTLEGVESIKSGEVVSYNDKYEVVYTNAGTFAEEGYMIPEDMVVVAFDNELNRYELTFSDLVFIKDRFDEESEKVQMVFMTYVDENDEVQVAYIITDWADFEELEDGTLENDLHEDVVNSLS